MEIKKIKKHFIYNDEYFKDINIPEGTEYKIIYHTTDNEEILIEFCYTNSKNMISIGRKLISINSSCL